MNVAPHTEEQRHHLHTAGKTDHEIAAAVGTTRRAITRWRATRNLPPNPKPEQAPPVNYEWRTNAACHGMNTDLWFPERKDAGYQEARRICRTCNEQTACLTYILTLENRHGPRFGMWSGLTPDERQTLVRKQTRIKATT